MINIYIDCSQPEKSQLIRFLIGNNISLTDQITSQTILIKEVTTENDLRWLSKIKSENNCDILCIIEKNDLTFEILDLKPLGIWRKQYLNKDCQLLMGIIDYKMNNTFEIMEFKSGDNKIMISTNNIIYIECLTHYLTIYSDNSQFRVREKISTALLQLERFGFIQIHKSFLVNKRYISSLTSTECILINGVRLPIGRKFKNTVL